MTKVSFEYSLTNISAAAVILLEKKKKESDVWFPPRKKDIFKRFSVCGEVLLNKWCVCCCERGVAETLFPVTMVSYNLRQLPTFITRKPLFKAGLWVLPLSVFGN
jgi:hypothetical protein